MYEIGRICIKIAGRDAAKKCVVVENIDNRFVLIDGETRRRKCNVMHLEPLDQVLQIKKGASHADVKAAFKKIGVELVDKKPKKAEPRPVRVRRVKKKEEKSSEKKPVKTTPEKKKEEVKKEAAEPSKKETKKVEKTAKKTTLEKKPAKKKAEVKKE